MKQRIITATIALGLFIPILVLSNIYSDLIVLSLVIAALSVIGVYEMLKCIGTDRHLWLSVPAYLIAVSMPVLAFLMRAKNDVFLLIFGVVFVLYLQYMFIYAIISHSRSERMLNYSLICQTFVSTLYIVFGFTAVIMMRYVLFNGKELGKYFYLLIFIGAWVTDTFAYFVGRFFGKHKLSPEISPKKTVEGSIGGIVFCVLSFLVFTLIVGKIVGISGTVFTVVMLLAGFFVSVVSQMGDLIASYVKREHGVKDYGKLFPGHGGVMDRFDSILGASSVLFIVFYIAGAFGLFI